MTAYVTRRLTEVLVVLFAVSTMIFILLRSGPHGVCGIPYVRPHPFNQGPLIVSPAPAKVDCVAYFHLDEPIVNQYLAFLGSYLHGNLGISTQQGEPSVGSILSTTLPATLLLITVSFIFQQLIALPLGMFAAVRRYSFFDGLFSAVSYIALSTPAFILGFVLIYAFAVEWGMLPAGETADVALPIFATGSWFMALWQDPALVLGDIARHLVLPAATLMLVGIALDSRFMRASMLQVLREDYIRTAKAKGVRSPVIIFKHAFRNALPPIITNMALYFPALIGTAMVVETVFSYTEGVGYTFTHAILLGDAPLEQAIFMVWTLGVLLANLMADVAYGIADPRVRYD